MKSPSCCVVCPVLRPSRLFPSVFRVLASGAFLLLLSGGCGTRTTHAGLDTGEMDSAVARDISPGPDLIDGGGADAHAPGDVYPADLMPGDAVVPTDEMSLADVDSDAGGADSTGPGDTVQVADVADSHDGWGPDLELVADIADGLADVAVEDMADWEEEVAEVVDVLSCDHECDEVGETSCDVEELGLRMCAEDPETGCRIWGEAVLCDDGLACTIDLCDPLQAICAAIAGDDICSDGNACNGIELCDLDLGCLTAPSLDCDDDVACTIDSCEPATGCQYESSDMLCNDGNVCTLGQCFGQGGCFYSETELPCDDGDPCTKGDTCNGAGECLPDVVLCGEECQLCGPGEECDSPADCESKVCKGGVCKAPQCDDEVANGAESDLDCGGGVCDECIVGRGCNLAADCLEGFCSNGTCVVPPCINDMDVGIPVHTRLVGENKTEVDIICRPAGDVFSLIVLPDTQMYSAATSPHPDMFDSQTQFIRVMYNNPANNMIFAVHVGDVVNNAVNPVEWVRARAAMDKLTSFEWEGVSHYMPYGVAWGDHDVLSTWEKPVYPDEPRDKYSSEILTGLFSAAEYKADQTYDGNEWWKRWFRSHTNRFARNSYHFFDAGGDQYMILFLEYCPDQDTIDWAAERLQWYAATGKDRTAILVMHSFIDTAGGFHDIKWSSGYEKCWEFENAFFSSGNPSDIFTQLVVPYNIRIVLSGHDNGGGWNGTTYSRMRIPAAEWGQEADRDVHVFLSNYQYVGSADKDDGIPNGAVGSGLGYFKVMRFYPNEDRVHSSVWSEWSKKNNGGKWNPTYAPGDTDKLNPLNFAGDATKKFNEDKICQAHNPEADNPGRCGNWGEPIPGACGHLEDYVEENMIEHPGPAFEYFVARCNRFSVHFEMTGD